MFCQQRRQMLAHVARPIQYSIQQEGARPQGLPGQRQVAFVVRAGAFNLFALHFDLRVVEEQLQSSPMQDASGLGLGQKGSHQIGIDLMQRQHARLGLRAQPLSQSAFVGSFLESDQFQQHRVLAQSFGVRQTDAAAGEGKEQLGDDTIGGKA